MFLVATEGLSYDEEAVSYGVAVGMIKSGIYRARAYLSEYMGFAAANVGCGPADAVERSAFRVFMSRTCAGARTTPINSP